jgi:hypothetical protein
MTFFVSVLVPGDGALLKERVLATRSDFTTLYDVRSWLGAHREMFRSCLAQHEPYFEAWVYDEKAEPVLYVRHFRDGFGPDGEVIRRGMLREMRKRAVKPVAVVTAKPNRALNGKSNGHSNSHSNGQPNGKVTL